MIVVLNGPSSAGKSTLARAVRDRVGASLVAVSIDQFFPCVHADARKGWDLFATLTEAMFATAAAFARGGFDVVVDTVFERADCIAIMRRALAEHPHRLVAMTCPVGVLEAREQARGNRRIGQARDQHARVLHDAVYDLYLDTHALSLDACVDGVVTVLHDPSQPRCSPGAETGK